MITIIQNKIKAAVDLLASSPIDARNADRGEKNVVVVHQNIRTFITTTT